MTLYEIDRQLMDLLDDETGEIADYEAFEALRMERDAKIENVALWVKNLKAEAEAIRAEEKALAERRQAAAKKAESLESWLEKALDGQNFRTARCACSFRKTQSADPDEEFIGWAMINAPDLLKYKAPEADKQAIKRAIKEGRHVEHATIKDGLSFSIK